MQDRWMHPVRGIFLEAEVAEKEIGQNLGRESFVWSRFSQSRNLSL
jgi:hypothetical protein